MKSKNNLQRLSPPGQYGKIAKRFRESMEATGRRQKNGSGNEKAGRKGRKKWHLRQGSQGGRGGNC